MNNTIDELTKVLNDDLLLRTPVIQYSIKDLTDLNKFIGPLEKENNISEVIKLLVEHATKNVQSVIAIYLLSILHLKSGGSYKIYAEKFVNLFTTVKKPSIVIFFAQELLSHYESIFALQTLAKFFSEEHQLTELVDIWERILKKDPKEYNLSLKIAKAKAKMDLRAESLRYYKMAFFRALEGKDFSVALQTYHDIFHLDPEDFGFIYENGKKLRNLLGKEKRPQVFQKVSSFYYQGFIKEKKYIEENLILYKEVMHEDAQNPELRTKLIELFKEKHKKHAQLEEILNFSGLTKPWKDIAPQLKTFENLVRFDQGVFVHHQSFGYGKISKIELPLIKKPEKVNETKIFIDFQKKKKHLMSFRIAQNSLSVCHDHNLYALKIFEVEKAKNLLAEDLNEFIDDLFITLNKPINQSDCKKLIVPEIVETGKWASKWKEIKAQLSRSNKYELVNKYFQLREKGSSFKDELINQFFSAKRMKNKIKITGHFIANFGKEDEGLKKILDYYSQESAKDITSTLCLQYFVKQHQISLEQDILTVIESQLKKNKTNEVFEQIPDVLRNTLIDSIVVLLKDSFETILEDIFLNTEEGCKAYILDTLLKNHKNESIQRICDKVLSSDGSSADAYISLIKFLFNLDTREIEVDYFRMFSGLLSLLEKSHKDTSFEERAPVARKNFQQAHSLLFDHPNLFNYLKEEENTKNKEQLFSLLNKMGFLENYLKIEIKELMSS